VASRTHRRFKRARSIVDACGGVDEYSGLAQRVAVAVGDVRWCLIMSRDGMILGIHPEGAEASAKPAWLQFAGLGQVEKGYVEFADQLWAFVRRGPYAAFAIAAPSIRPGLLMDQMEQALLAAEEARARRDALKAPEGGPAPSGKPRTSLHPIGSRSRDEEAEVDPILLAKEFSGLLQVPDEADEGSS
jgi:hypothetical protein